MLALLSTHHRAQEHQRAKGRAGSLRRDRLPFLYHQPRRLHRRANRESGQRALQSGERDRATQKRSQRHAHAGGRLAQQLGLHGNDLPGLESEGVVRLALAQFSTSSGVDQDGVPSLFTCNRFVAGPDRAHGQTCHLSHHELTGGSKISSQLGSTCAGSVLLSKAKRSGSTPQFVAARGELCSDTATIRYLGTMPNAQSRIPTHYAPAPCGSVTRIARKDLEKYHLRDARAIRASFSLILGLAHASTYFPPTFVPSAPFSDFRIFHENFFRFSQR